MIPVIVMFDNIMVFALVAIGVSPRTLASSRADHSPCPQSSVSHVGCYAVLRRPRNGICWFVVLAECNATIVAVSVWCSSVKLEDSMIVTRSTRSICVIFHTSLGRFLQSSSCVCRNGLCVACGS